MLIGSFPSWASNLPGTGSTTERPPYQARENCATAERVIDLSYVWPPAACAYTSACASAVGAGESPVGYLERVQAHHLDGRLLLAGERVGDDRLAGDDESGHLPRWMIGSISLISPMLAHQAAYVGRWRASRRRLVAELLCGVTVLSARAPPTVTASPGASPSDAANAGDD